MEPHSSVILTIFLGTKSGGSFPWLRFLKVFYQFASCWVIGDGFSHIPEGPLGRILRRYLDPLSMVSPMAQLQLRSRNSRRTRTATAGSSPRPGMPPLGAGPAMCFLGLELETTLFGWAGCRFDVWANNEVTDSGWVGPNSAYFWFMDSTDSREYVEDARSGMELLCHANSWTSSVDNSVCL